MNKNEELDVDVIDAIQSGQKIQAIKLLRERRNIGLKEAKEVVDSYIVQNPDIQITYKENANKFPIIFIVFVIIAIALYFSGVLGK